MTYLLILKFGWQSERLFKKYWTFPCKINSISIVEISKRPGVAFGCPFSAVNICSAISACSSSGADIAYSWIAYQIANRIEIENSRISMKEFNSFGYRPICMKLVRNISIRKYSRLVLLVSWIVRIVVVLDTSFDQNNLPILRFWNLYLYLLCLCCANCSWSCSWHEFGSSNSSNSTSSTTFSLPSSCQNQCSCSVEFSRDAFFH